MNIKRARSEDAAALTRIAFAAKRHWGYPEKWIESWRNTLVVGSQFIIDHETYAAVVNGQIVGFHALSLENGEAELIHLWVLPEAMGRGIGRALFAHAVERAREMGCRQLKIESDPNAEGFYQRMGAQRTGVNLAELAGQRRELPVLIYSIW